MHYVSPHAIRCNGAIRIRKINGERVNPYFYGVLMRRIQGLYEKEDSSLYKARESSISGVGIIRITIFLARVCDDVRDVYVFLQHGAYLHAVLCVLIWQHGF